MGRIQVLCVDDDQSLLDLTKTFLERESDQLAVETAVTFQDALESLESTSVDCVVSDYDLERETGLELLRAVREDHHDLPFVLFTGKGSEAVAAEAISAGVTDYLQKGGREQYALLANRIENAAEADEVERRLERAREKTAQLHGHAADIAGARSRETVYDAVLSAAEDILEFTVYGLYVAGEDEFEPVGEESYDPGKFLSLTHGILGQTYQTGDSYLVEDASKHETASPERPSFRSAISIPIGDRVVFQAIADEPGAFTESDFELAELLATHAEQAIERLASERERRRTNEQLEAILENTTAIVYIKDTEGRYQLVNDRFQEVTGLDEDEMLGKTDWDIQDDEYAAAVRANDERALAEERPIEVEEDAYRDGERRTYYSVKVPLFDEDGEPMAVCGISSEITELKRRERQLERQRNRLDEFASVVSHDLRGPLSVAEGYRDLLAEDLDDERLDEIETAHERMDEIIDDVLTLAREGEAVVDPEPVEIESVVETAWAAATTDPDATLEVDGEGVVEADSSRLRRLFQNCFRNALEHGESVETVRVTVTESGFSIADDGCGIPQAEASDVFEFGVTTESGGTGIGLAVVREIVDAHGWSVSCTESESGGARFEFRADDGPQSSSS